MLGIVGVVDAGIAQEDAANPFEWSGVTRARYETLDGQFRSGRTGSDSILALRTLIAAKYSFDRFHVVGELHDARTYFDDDGTPLNTSFVNVADILQAYVGLDLPLGDSHSSTLRLGRFTVNIGGRRFAARNGFRNTINAYNGIHWQVKGTNGSSTDVFYTRPVRRLPSERDSLDSNDFDFDETVSNRRFWGVHYQRPGLIAGDIQLDAFAYGLNEWDQPGRASADREHYTTGFRLLKNPQRGGFDFEFEIGYRFGDRSESDAPDAATLDVRAHTLHFDGGYTFDSDWKPRVGIEYDSATGERPGDGRYERYEVFFGVRRGDFGNTSLHGPLRRSNVSAPGLRFSFAKGRTDGRLMLKRASLESATDTWLDARLTDPTGASGRTLGKIIDFRVRHWLIPKRFRLEVGGSGLWYGRFVRSVPNGPEGSRTLYGYTQVEFFF